MCVPYTCPLWWATTMGNRMVLRLCGEDAARHLSTIPRCARLRPEHQTAIVPGYDEIRGQVSWHLLLSAVEDIDAYARLNLCFSFRAFENLQVFR